MITEQNVDGMVEKHFHTSTCYIFDQYFEMQERKDVKPCNMPLLSGVKRKKKLFFNADLSMTSCLRAEAR